MNFAIIPQRKICESYVWRFQTLEEAKAAASNLSERLNLDVLVVKVLGEWTRGSTWEEVEG